jgi:hypothetical protein
MVAEPCSPPRCSSQPVSVKQSKFSLASLEDWWVLEVIALFLSAVLLAATLARALVLLPVSRSLGQLKWTWFATRSRNLADVQSFDDASRGVIGSTQLLFSRRGWY